MQCFASKRTSSLSVFQQLGERGGMSGRSACLNYVRLTFRRTQGSATGISTLQVLEKGQTDRRERSTTNKTSPKFSGRKQQKLASSRKHTSRLLEYQVVILQINNYNKKQRKDLISILILQHRTKQYEASDRRRNESCLPKTFRVYWEKCRENDQQK